MGDGVISTRGGGLMAGADALNLTFASWDHDRVMPLHDGRVQVPGINLKSVIQPTSKLFPLAVGGAPYDVTEMSISSYVIQVSRGIGDYVAIPAFVSRAFRHSGFFVRDGSGIKSPAELSGKKVGVPEYQMTAALWMRGILRDEYSVAPESVHWRTGALDAGVRRERLELALPKGCKLSRSGRAKPFSSYFRMVKSMGCLHPSHRWHFWKGITGFEDCFRISKPLRWHITPKPGSFRSCI